MEMQIAVHVARTRIYENGRVLNTNNEQYEAPQEGIQTFRAQSE